MNERLNAISEQEMLDETRFKLQVNENERRDFEELNEDKIEFIDMT